MKHKHILIIALFVFFVCTLAAAQTRRIEAKKKTQESSGFAMSNPELVFNVGHSGWGESVCYSPDRKYVVSGSEDKTIKIWEIETGRCIRTLEEHTSSVTSVVYSPNGKYVASGSGDGTIKLWEVSSGSCVKTLEEHTSSVTSVVYSPNGRYVVSGSFDDTIKVWEVTTGVCIKTLIGHTGSVYSVAYSPDGKYVASGSRDKTIKVWEAATGECIRTLEGHTDTVYAVCYSPNGKYVASGSSDKTIKLWGVATGVCIKTCEGHTGSVYSVAYSPDGKSIASGSFDDTIKLWEVASGSCVKTLKAKTVVTSLSYSPDGAYLASSFWDNEIKLWDLATEECIKTFGGHTNSVYSVCYSPNGKYLATGSADGVKLWNVTTGEYVKELIGQDDVVYSSDGKYIASSSSPHVVNLSEVATGECIKRFEGHTDWLKSVAYSPDGKYIASGSKDKTIKLWKVATGECVKTFEGHTDTVYSVAYSPDGKYVASGSEDETINIWEVASGKCVKTLNGHTNDVQSVNYSPDGKYIVSGSLDDTIKIWEVASGNCVKTLEGHTGPVKYVSYSRNGTYLASGSWDRTIKLWKVVTGECIKTLAGHTDWVNSVCYSPDGTYLASGSNDDTIKFWDASTGTLLATTFCLDGEEWLTYTPEGFFAGSEWATKNLVHIVDGMKTVGIDQMYDSLYRPDLVSAKLSGEDISIYAKRVNFASLMQTGSAPITSFLNLDEEITNRDVTIEYSIQNTGGGIGEVNLLLNGKNIRLAENVPSKNGQTLYFSHTVTLQNGKNTLELYAKNEAGKVESLRAKTTLNWHGNTRKPNLYLLTVAVNQYSDRGLQLKYAVPDAQIITQGFSRQKKSLYQNIFTFNLFDGNVTKEGLKSIFQELSKKVEADDVFVFYIAGHGVTYGEDGDYYYLPSNFLFTSSQAIQEQGISKNDLTRCLSLIKAGKTLILMDTCNSGSFLDAGKRGMTEKMAVDRLTRSTGHATIVASSDTQSAMEGYEGHGIFTYIVVEGLNGKADADRDGFITLQELSSYVEDEVPKRSFDKWGYKQVPMRDLRKQDFPLYTSGNR